MPLRLGIMSALALHWRSFVWLPSNSLIKFYFGCPGSSTPAELWLFGEAPLCWEFSLPLREILYVEPRPMQKSFREISVLGWAGRSVAERTGLVVPTAGGIV